MGWFKETMRELGEVGEALTVIGAALEHEEERANAYLQQFQVEIARDTDIGSVREKRARARAAAQNEDHLDVWRDVASRCADMAAERLGELAAEAKAEQVRAAQQAEARKRAEEEARVAALQRKADEAEARRREAERETQRAVQATQEAERRHREIARAQQPPKVALALPSPARATSSPARVTPPKVTSVARVGGTPTMTSRIIKPTSTTPRTNPSSARPSERAARPAEPRPKETAATPPSSPRPTFASDAPRPIPPTPKTPLTSPLRVGADLKRWREKEGLSQRQAAERLGVAHGTVGKAEAAPTVALPPALKGALTRFLLP